MKLGSSTRIGLGALLLFSPSLGADEIRLDQVIARSPRDLAVRSPYEDGPLLELLHLAQMEATGAQASVAPPLPSGVAILEGPVAARDVSALARGEVRLVSVELTGSQIRNLLERTASRFALYTYEPDRPLLATSVPDSLLDTMEGVSYELDLTRPAGDRVLHLTFQGAPLDSARKLRVAMDEWRLKRGDVDAGSVRTAGPLRDALLAQVRGRGALGAGFDRNWSLLPDYVTLTERPHVDRLVRLGAAPKDEVHRLYGDQPGRRGDVAYWLSRSFGWREARLSGAYPDAPEWLEPWLDGLLKRKILAGAATEELFRPFAPATLQEALEWCENAARHEGYALGTRGEVASFHLGLLAGTSIGLPRPGTATLTRAQLLGVVANARFPEIRVLETTDFHGALLPRDRGRARKRGGAAALAAHIERLRAENPEGTVLLDGGDLFQGTMVSNLFFGRPVLEHMNRLGYTAAAIGNHEFDWSVDTLVARIREMRFAALAANIVERKTRKRPRWARSDTLFARRGVRIGLLGLAYPATPKVTLAQNVAMLDFLDDSATAARIVPALRRGAEIVIGLGHVPATQDSAGQVHGSLARLARGVPGVDLWLGGHSHTVVAGEVAGVPTMVSGSHGEWIGVCDLVVDPSRDRVVERRWRLVATWVDEVAPDSAAEAIVQRWENLLGDQGSMRLGWNARRLTKSRGGESSVGSLVADVMREAAGAEIALQNNGGLRAELPEGPITRSAVFEVLPFDNEIVTMTLLGSQVKQALEEGLAHERIVQVSGIRYRFDLGQPPGARVTALTDAAGRTLDLGRGFRVAVNDFMAQGGDNHEVLTIGRDRESTGLGLRDAVEQSLQARCRAGALDYQGDGRVTREPGSKPPARGEGP